MADEEEIVVALEPDEGKTDVVITEDRPRKADGTFAATKEADTELEPVADITSQFKELQAQAERDRTAREESDRRAADARRDADRARKDATTARSEVVDSQLDSITTSLAAAQAEANAAEQKYRVAYDAGDRDAMATANREMARAETRIARFDEAKADLESRRAAPVEEQQQETRTEEPKADPFEAYVSKFSDPTATWMRAHRDWVTDQRKSNKLQAAHFSAEDAGIKLDSPEYFEHVETYIGLRQAPAASANGKANGHANGQQQPAKRRPSVPVAPVQQSGGGTGGNGNEVRLKSFEARAATDGTHVWNYDDPSGQKKFKKGDPIGVQEFARRKKTMTEQGLYDRTFTES